MIECQQAKSLTRFHIQYEIDRNGKKTTELQNVNKQKP